METQIQKITKDTNIGEIVENFPQTIETLESFGVHCVGCQVSAFESIEMGFKTHGMSDEQITDAVKKLNEVVGNTPVKKKEDEPEFDYSTAKLNVTDKAAEKIKGLMEEHKKAGLRIGIVPGGCSGNSYSMELDDKSDENDIVIEEKTASYTGGRPLTVSYSRQILNGNMAGGAGEKIAALSFTDIFQPGGLFAGTGYRQIGGLQAKPGGPALFKPGNHFRVDFYGATPQIKGAVLS